MAGLLKELWIGELIKNFRHDQTFLGRIPSANQFVNNDAINLAHIGADPTVLINNNTYPINSAQREDDTIVISLDKLETENTIITDDELYALPYDKKGSVLNQHREVLEEFAATRSLHSLCPAAINVSNQPVLRSTGNSNSETVARRRLTVNDVIRMKRALDLLKIPMMGREMVLNPWHVEDLLMSSEAFKEQWYKKETGKILNMFGFEISEMAYYPVFSQASGNKAAFNAVANPADDLAASVVMYRQRAVQARGSVTMYYARAEDDPKYRQSEVGFRLYHVCIPKTALGLARL
ncbi:MAG: hypothetical protein HC896_00300 [Bacteroidales bacterium]|nr:hypothetical protein [Bacteroidales bacterium]